MLIEIYKGINIYHDAVKDEFHTTIVINRRNNKPDEFIKSSRLQKTRDDIDKFLNTAAKKPVLKKVWLKDYREYIKAEVVIYNPIVETVIVNVNGNQSSIKLNTRYSNNDKECFLCCKENDAIIQNLNKKNAEKDKINKEISCSSGKLIPLKVEHFK